jgi:hypothetical protein
MLINEDNSCKLLTNERDIYTVCTCDFYMSLGPDRVPLDRRLHETTPTGRLDTSRVSSCRHVLPNTWRPLDSLGRRLQSIEYGFLRLLDDSFFSFVQQRKININKLCVYRRTLHEELDHITLLTFIHSKYTYSVYFQLWL